MWEKTEPFTVRRVDDREEFQLRRCYRRAVDKLADVASPDGREVYSTNEIDFYFADEPDRPMRIVESD